MDGLAGISYPDVYQMTASIAPMLEIQKHRGNGKTIVHTYRNVEVGVVNGHLEFNEQRSICVGLDGSIENEGELAIKLKLSGHKGHLNSPCQMLIAAYEQWGDEFAEKIKGEFSIFILDERIGSILLIRDRIGKKPLYWYQDACHFIFASELKALLATGMIAKTVASDAFASYLYLGYIPQDLSPIQGVSKLLPGHLLKFTKDGCLSIEAYWSLSEHFLKPQTVHQNLLAKKLDHLLTHATKELTPESGTLNCCLSGGLGSSSVAHYLRKEGALNRTVGLTATYKNINPEDGDAAREVSEALDIPHICEAITPEMFVEEFATFAWHLDEPLADPNSLMSWTLAKMAKNDTKDGEPAMFSGMGSDELLAGHSRYTTQEHKSSKWNQWFNLAFNQGLKGLIPIAAFFNSSFAYDLLRHSRRNTWQMTYLEENALFSKDLMQEAAPDFVQMFDPDVFLSKFHKLHKIRSPVASFLYFDVKTRLADCYLLQFERASSAFGLKFCTPFLDVDVIEFCASLPAPDSINESQAFLLLKSLMQKVYPEKVINRPKRSRANFLQSWAESEEFNTLFPLLMNSNLVETGMINPDWLEDVLKSKELQKKNFKWLFALLCFEVWYKLYITLPLEMHAPKISLRQLLTKS